MRYGQFYDARQEYVITRPDTPYPWINYLGSEDFFSLLSNTSGGYSFYKDARLLRLTRYRYNNLPRRRGWHLLLHPGRRIRLEPRLDACEGGIGPVRVPPWAGLHGDHRRKGRPEGRRKLPLCPGATPRR